MLLFLTSPASCLLLSLLSLPASCLQLYYSRSLYMASLPLTPHFSCLLLSLLSLLVSSLYLYILPCLSPVSNFIIHPPCHLALTISLSSALSFVSISVIHFSCLLCLNLSLFLSCLLSPCGPPLLSLVSLWAPFPVFLLSNFLHLEHKGGS